MMAEGRPLRQLRLDNGLILEIFDRSNRYFGDYYRVHLEVLGRLPLTPELFTAGDDPQLDCRRAQQQLGDELRESRILERMGVSGAMLAETRHAMVESFLSTNLPYLRRPEYPARLLARTLAEQRRRRSPRLVPR